MATNAQAGPSKTAGRLAPGSGFAGKFTIECLRYVSAFAEVYQATDTSSGQPKSVHLLLPALAQDSARIGQVRDAIDGLPKTAPEGVALPREIQTGDNAFVLTDFVDGHSARQLLLRKQQTGARGFSPRGARNLLLQIISALEKMPAHGALSLDAITVDKSGHATLTDFAMWPLSSSGAAPSRDADILAIGRLVHELLVGAPPAPTGATALPTGSATERLVSRLLAKNLDPSLRDLSALKNLMSDALAPKTSPGGTSNEVRRKSLAHGIATGSVAAVATAQPVSVSESEERWLISKGKLDFGPFAMSRVIVDIRRNDILPGHLIIDSHSGVRTPVENHPLTAAEVAQAQQKRDDNRRAQAEVSHAKQEKRRGFALYGLIVAGILGLGLGAYGLVAALRSNSARESGAISSLGEATLEPRIGASMIQDEVARTKRRPRTAGHRPRGQNADDWDAPLDLGDASEGDDEGDERLTNSQINPVIKKNGGALGKCLAKSGVRKANIRFIVRGTGKVTYVSVNNDSNSGLSSCVRGVMSSAAFPTFNGTRTRAAFDMSL